MKDEIIKMNYEEKLKQENNFLKEMIRTYYVPEIDRLTNIINELEEYCKEEYYRKSTTDIDSIGFSTNIYVCIYMKIKEFKENNND